MTSCFSFFRMVLGPAPDELGQVRPQRCVLPRPVCRRRLSASGQSRRRPDARSMRPVPLIRVPDIFRSGRNGELEATEPVAEIRCQDNVGVVWQQTDVADTQVAAEHTVKVKLVQACPGLSPKKTPVTNDVMFFFFFRMVLGPASDELGQVWPQQCSAATCVSVTSVSHRTVLTSSGRRIYVTGSADSSSGHFPVRRERRTRSSGTCHRDLALG